jgi:micrococcal nuclease
VVDGDTIILKLPGGRQSCRLIGVDTPETVHPNKAVERYGKEASMFLKKMVEGKDVRIGNNGPEPTFDKYHRRLVYVYLDGPPPVFVNREILAQGYGRLFESQRFAYKDDFRVAQERARRAGLGLWASPAQSDW